MAPPPPSATAAVQAMSEKENPQQRPLQRRISMSTQQRQPLQPRNENRTSLAAAHSTAPPSPTLKEKSQPTPETLEAKWDEARSYTGPSPAAMWYTFYEWSLTHATPAVTQSILETAVNALADGTHRSHYNNPHCTLLFVQWAEYMAQPMEYYGDVWQEGIGRELGLFYTNWADCCEGQGCWDEADSVYMKGLMAQAQPLGELIAAYNQFKQRWAEQRRRKDEAGEVSASTSASKKRSASEDAGTSAAKQAKTASVAVPQTVPAAASGDERDEPGYDPTVLHHECVEQQFEEARARHWRATHPPPPPPQQQIASAQSTQPAAKQPKRQALRRMDLSPAQPQLPTAAASAPAALTPTSRSESNDLASFFQADVRADSGMNGVRQASPTMFTRAAADEVDDMWHDTTSIAPIIVPASSASNAGIAVESDGRPSYSFTSRSLTSDLSQVQTRTPAGSVPDYRARPSPVSFNIHEDTELIALSNRTQPQPPQLQSAVSSFEVYQDTALLSPGALASLRTTAAEEEDDEVALAESVARHAASVGSATPVSAAGVGKPRVASSIGLTPILETSRESDASSLSNLSIRSSSSISTTATPSARLAIISTVTPLPTAPSIVITDTPTSPAAIDPFSHATRALIVNDLHFATESGVSVTVHEAEASDELRGLLGEAADGVEGSTVEVGELFLRVEKRMKHEEAGGRERVCVYGVQDMDSGDYHVMHVLPSPSLWCHYISHCLTTRLTNQPTAMSSFHLVSSSHQFTDMCCSFLPPTSEYVTLASLLLAYQRKGKAMGEALVHYYTAELLHSLLLLSSASIIHTNLTATTIHIPATPPPSGDYSSDRSAAWCAHSVRVGAWHQAVDVLVLGREAVDERLDVAALVAVMRAMLAAGGGSGGGGGLRERGVLASAVLRLECCAGESEGGSVSVRHLVEVKEDVERWLMGEGGARVRLLKKLLCEQSVMLSSA